MTKITAIAAIVAAVVLGCNPPTNPPPTPVQSKTPLKLVYGTDNTIQAVRNKALDSPRPTLTPKNTTAKYSISDAPAWLTVNPDTGVLSAAADKTGALTKGAEFTATVTAAGVGGAYDKETAEAKISINVVDELTITFNPPAGTTPPGAGELHVTGTKNTQIEFGGTFTVNPPDPSAAYELDADSDPLPPGLTIDPKTGKITGTPTAPTKGPINIIIRVKDTTAKTTLRLQINPDAFPGMYYPLTTTIARGSRISVALTGAEGVTASYAFDTSGSNPADPSWLNIDSNTGAISVGNAAAPVPETEPFGTTTYKITVTGTGQYAAIPPETLDFSLTVQAAMFPNPLNLSMGSMILNSDNRSGNASVTDSNDPKLTVTYAYAPNPPNTATPTRPSWLGINSETGAITVTNAPNSAFPAVGATKIYKIRITGTGIYEGREKDIDFVTSGAAINLPTGMAYAARTTVEKGSSMSGTDAVSVLNAPGVDATYAFEPSPPAPPWLTINEDSGAVSIGPTAANRSATVPADAHGATGGERTYKIKVTGQGIYKDKTRILDFTLRVDPAPIGTFTYSGRRVSNDPGGAQIINITASNTALTTADLSLSSSIADISKVTFSISKTNAVPTGGTTFNAHTDLNFNEGKITGTPSKVFTQATYVITATGNDGTIYQGATAATKTINITVNPASIGTFTYSGTAAGTPTSSTDPLPITLTAKNTALTTADLSLSSSIADINKVTFSINAEADFNTKTNLTLQKSGVNKGKITGTPSKVFTAGATYTITATGNDGTIYQGATPATKRIRIKVDPASIGTFTYSGTAAGTPTSAGVLPITLTAKNTALTTAVSTDDVFLDVSSLNPEIANVTFSINDATDFSTKTNLTFNTSGTNKGKITGTPSKVFTAGATYTITATGNDGTIYQGATPATKRIRIKVDPASIGTFTYSGTAAGTPTSAGVLPITLTAKNTALTTAVSTDDVFLDVSSLNPEIANVTFSINDATDFSTKTNLTFNTSGTNKGKITGTPSKVFTDGATYTITATGDNGIYQGATATKRIRIKVDPASFGTISYSDTSALVANIGTAITARTITAPTGAGHTNVTYSIAPNLNTNTGLNFNTANGTIHGTPTKAFNNTSYTITATGNDNTIYQGYTRSTTIAIRVPTVIPNVAYSSLSVAKGSSGTTRAVSGAPAGGGLTYTFAATQPDWLGIDSTTGTITVGTDSTTNKVPANANSSYSIVVNVNGAAGGTYDGAAQKTVTFALTVTPAVIPDVRYASAEMTKGTAGERGISRAPSTGLTYAFAATQPAWLGINSTTGRISIGTTTNPVPGSANSSYSIGVNVNGSAGSIYAGAAQKTVTFNLTVKAATLPTNMSYGGTKTVARGGDARTTLTNSIDALYTVTGVAVSGTIDATKAPSLVVDNDNGAVTGPTSVPATTPVGTYTYTIRVTGKPGSIYTGTDASPREVTFTLRVTPAPIPTTMSYAAASVLRGSAVTASLTNGIDANYAQQSVEVPTGAATSNAPALTFNTTNGAITGPTIAAATPVGTYTYTIRVTGKAGTIYEGAAHVDVTFALTVTQPLPTGMSYSTSYISRNASDPASRTITASAGGAGGVLQGGVSAAEAEYRFASSTPKPSWMSISNVGIITGTMPQTMPLGQHDYTIEVIGKGTYAGSTRNVTFTLHSQGT